MWWKWGEIYFDFEKNISWGKSQGPECSVQNLSYKYGGDIVIFEQESDFIKVMFWSNHLIIMGIKK